MPGTLNKDLIFACLAWAGFVLILGIVPWLFAPESGLPNTASMQGYNIGLAYLLTAGWTLCIVLMFWIYGDIEHLDTITSPPSPGHTKKIKLAEVLIVGSAVTLFYWPAALARFGPHVEDSYFLATLWRMACGEIPYTDFEFLYGPAMIHLPGWWLTVTGFSMKSYYTVLMLLQVAFFVTLVFILQKYTARFWLRLLAFLVLLPFFLDILFGLNWIPWRHFSVVLVILVLARNPHARSAAVIAAIIAGLAAAYSYEYGIAALLSGLAILITLLFESNRLPIVLNMLLLPLVAIAVWALTTFAMTGFNFSAYISSTLHIAETASELGLGQFAFHWTIHSLALFFLLASLAVIGGRGLRHLGRVAVSEGDLHLIGAAVFALVSLKIAFQRVDHVHLIVPFIPLILMLALNQPRRLLVTSRALRNTMLSAIVIVSITHAIGNVPLGRLVTFGIARGLLHEATDRPVVGQIDSRYLAAHGERSESKSEIIDIAARLNAPDLRDKPVLFYGGIWSRGVEAGICPAGYSFYDLLYSDARKPLVNTARTTSDLIVVMRQRDYGRLFSGAEPNSPTRKPNILERAARITSSVHFTETRLETDIEYDMWKLQLGDELTRTYQFKERFADVVLLEQKR